MDIFEASREGNLEILKELIGTGVDKNVKDIDGDTSLMEASWFGRSECVRLLLEAGADKDIKNDNGHTALIRSSRYGHTECIRLLLEAGADKDIKNNNGHTALTVTKNKHIIKLLNRVSLGLLMNKILNYDLIRHISVFL